MAEKDIFTSSEVAKICGVAVRTVVKWLDSGQLQGYRIPGSKDRRIPIDCLKKFLVDHDMGCHLEKINESVDKAALEDFTIKWYVTDHMHTSSHTFTTDIQISTEGNIIFNAKKFLLDNSKTLNVLEQHALEVIARDCPHIIIVSMRKA